MQFKTASRTKEAFFPLKLTIDIGVEDLVEGIHGHLGERRDEVDPGVVDEHVDAAVLPQRVCHGGARALLGPHVELQQQEPRVALEVAHGAARPRRGDDGAPGRREGARHRVPDAAIRAPRHQHHRPRPVPLLAA